MILKKIPATPVKFPPPRFFREHKVKAGENWQSIAAQYGIGDPWHLIEFNFVTRDPMEVNWYLELYVGCSKSEDGKNFCFDPLDDPGIVYIPLSDWSPDDDSRLRHIVVNALVGNILARVHVNYANQTLTGDDLIWVANSVITRDIRVVHDGSLRAGRAEYVSVGPGADTIKLGFRNAGTWSRKALIVHEAVHAALDLKSVRGMTVAQSESLAYVIQCYYMLCNTMKEDERLVDPDPRKDWVYELAWRMGAQLAESRQPSNLEWFALENAVRVHPTYRSSANKAAVFDGV